jgi:hypothetical protein
MNQGCEVPSQDHPQQSTTKGENRCSAQMKSSSGPTMSGRGLQAGSIPMVIG